jgi:hypothetical protein
MLAARRCARGCSTWCPQCPARRSRRRARQARTAVSATATGHRSGRRRSGCTAGLSGHRPARESRRSPPARCPAGPASRSVRSRRHGKERPPHRALAAAPGASSRGSRSRRPMESPPARPAPLSTGTSCPALGQPGRDPSCRRQERYRVSRPCLLIARRAPGPGLMLSRSQRGSSAMTLDRIGPERHHVIRLKLSYARVGGMDRDWVSGRNSSPENVKRLPLVSMRPRARAWVTAWFRDEAPSLR